MAEQVAAEQVIVGICRFSFLGRSDSVGWRTRTGTAEELRAAIAADLYARPRLEQRLRSFRRLCLASMRAQTDQGFIFLVLTSPQLPGWAMRRLRTLCAPCGNVEVIVSDAPTADAALEEPLAAIGALGDQVVLFRLDDDDALNVNYVAALRAHAARLRDLPGFAVSFASNLALSIYPGQPTGRWMIERPFVAAGLAVRLPEGRGLFSFPHFQMRDRLTSITDLRMVGGLVLKWPSDSRTGVVGRPRFGYRPLGEATFNRHIRQGFPFLRRFDFETLRAPEGGDAADAPPPGSAQGEA